MSNYSDSSFSKDENSSWYKVYGFIKPNSTILDIGCSSGNFGEIINAEKKCIVDGVEIYEDDFIEAKKKLRNVFKLDIETDDLSAIKEKYDYVYFGDVIEHLKDPVKSLVRIKKLLNSSGQIIFSIPNMAHLSVRLMLLQGKLEYGETGLLDKTHLHLYTHEEVQRVFNEAGFQITKLDPVLKDFPKELIGKELQKVGLKLTNKFVEFTRSTDASVYQYVGMAKPGSAINSKKLNISSPVDIFQVYLNQTKKHFEAKIKLQEELIHQLEKTNTELSVEYAKSLEVINQKQNPVIKKLYKKITKKIYRR